MGAPNEPAFQRRVLTALLGLFAAEKGPVLADFPDHAPGGPADMTGWSCPVNLAPPPAEGAGFDRLRDALAEEIERLRPWYAEAMRARGRTTVGIAGVPIAEIPQLLAAFAGNLAMESPQSGVRMHVLIKRATDDLKAYYYEAATAKPGRITDVALADWLWGETAAGKAMLALRKVCLGTEDAGIKALGQLQLLPNHQRDKGR